MEIVGFPNYLIYPDGRVFGKKRKRFLKPQRYAMGYDIVNLYKDNKGKTHTIHRLIAEHYIPNPNNYRCVDHINRIRTDNRIDNLRWATYEMNAQNRSKMNTNKSGHSYITYYKNGNKWRFDKIYNKHRYAKCFKSKIDCICYKYIFLLKHKAGLYKKNSFS